jgi:hypothetical protein
VFGCVVVSEDVQSLCRHMILIAVFGCVVVSEDVQSLCRHMFLIAVFWLYFRSKPWYTRQCL